jgi:hemerythrin-like metal-binding protein
MVRLSSEHFETEEGLMESTGYPGLAEHRARHEELSRKISEFMARYEEHDRASYVHLLYFARDWFQDHMRQEDVKYTPWLNAHGVQ